MTLSRRRFTASAALFAGWRSAAAAAPPGPAARDQALGALFDVFFSEIAADQPEVSTVLGVDRGARAGDKARLRHESPDAMAQRKAGVASQRDRLRAFGRDRLSAGSTVNYDAVLYDLETTAAADRRFSYGSTGAGSPFVVSQINGSYQEIPDFLETEHVIETTSDAEAYLLRLQAFARLLDEEGERVREDFGRGVLAPDFALDKTLSQLKMLAVPAAESTLVSSLADRAGAKGLTGDWRGRAGAVYADTVLPALDRQRLLVERLRPSAVHTAGVWRLPDGDAYYAAALQAQTTSRLSAAEVHQMGLDVTRELSARADTLFRKIGSTSGGVAERYRALFKDPRYLYPDTDAGKDREIADLNALVRRMEAALPTVFGVLPRASLEIRRIPAATEAGASTHYTPGSIDGSRPGIYWINLRDTGEAPYWDMPTTTFHEGVPGHHLQLSLQQEADLPLVRKLSGFGAYEEGWALYAEQLAQELGFYRDDPAGELGYVHDALLRSGRLVVDTGIHALRWSRERAVETLSGIDGDPLSLSAQEIERYACNPGQACSYMVGKRTFLSLRQRAKARLGAGFDLRAFHDAALGSGSLPLPVLESVIDAYVARSAAA